MYLNYKNSKVTIADYDPNYGPNGADPKEFLVTDLEISLNANATPSYEIGSRYSTTFSPDNGVNGSLNISYPITGEDHLLDFITNDSGSLSHYRTLSGNFGGLNFSSGYLQNYNLSVTPNNIISANASIVFFGALSYIGNAPNFMVKSIAEQSGVKMPSFGGYLVWASVILLPIYLLVTFLFI